ncbi:MULTISPECIES: cell wall hydrolase [Priestia]|uniref:Cell wall hydrolase SleB n=1 Tax=Priestia megaterium (strain WSH-002) TaxID=1006007 RepID=A0A8D3X2T0_PRIMW|nr:MULTISPECIES: cell wall hydrolase [Priestia]AEN89984.1 Cell wall hydrolase SleB [Priestia megaterium WSH-002]MBY0061731.1 cell wall hydrolase [Priestia aryabhattai]MDN3362278.1 cell wall hydrolase [Priestia megaterium]MED5244362.1 cell wall hydrolase [Priestia sp. LL-8]QDZ80779.1 LysM peptidoglycan-binding domain-containing protein [Priestia megaterium]
MFKKLAIIGALAIPMFGMNHGANAAETTHRVKSGETLYKIGAEYGVTVKQLKEANHKSTDSINANETLTIPNSISESDKDLLARLVQAEAKGEPYAGKVAVATVVLNRVDSDSFPDSIHDVIYQGTQFTPVQNGEINKAADAEAKKAVNEALAFRGQGKGSLFFFNPDKTSDQWLRQKQVTITIGNHVFAK